MLPFGIGVILGIIVVTKLIAKILKYWPNASTWGILGLIIASPFAIILKVGCITISPLIIIVSIINIFRI
jgi:putative membrane protein